jgi:hypothetical protein
MEVQMPTRIAASRIIHGVGKDRIVAMPGEPIELSAEQVRALGDHIHNPGQREPSVVTDISSVAERDTGDDDAVATAAKPAPAPKTAATTRDAPKPDDDDGEL